MNCRSNLLTLALAGSLGLPGVAPAQDAVRAPAETKAREAAAVAGNTGSVASAATGQAVDAMPATATPLPPATPVVPTPGAPHLSTSPQPPPMPVDATGRTVVMDGQTPVVITSHQASATKGKHTVDFPALDSNHDGWLSRNEAEPNATLRAGFAQADRDGDGRLTRGEFDGWTPPPGR